MTTRTVSKNRAIVFLTAQLFFAFALAVAFHPSVWAGEDLSTLREKAEAGDPKAQKSLGLLYYNGQGVPQDYAKAASWFRLAARQGYSLAQYNLGLLYANGQGVPQDYAKAAHWYRLAANQGNTKAQTNLGFLYEKGQGVPQDYAKAAHWDRLATKQGYAPAQFDLGVLYANGQGVPQDFGKAASWYRLAANQGLAQSQFNLGVLYEKGQGVPQDFGKAASWYRLAAKQGLAQAQFDLGVLYANGQGVPQDFGKAASWYRLAANQGLAQAQFNLGILYAKGQGVPQNYSRAYKWLTLAKAAGETSASRLLDLLMPRMTQDQVAEGQRLAEEWTAMKKGSAPTTDEARSTPSSETPGSTPASPDLSEIKKMLETQNQEIANMRSKMESSAKSAPHYSSMVDRPDFRLRENRHMYALVIGVEHYPGGLPDAQFADRDAQAVYRYLIALGVPPDHIRRLTDGTATRGRIRMDLRWLKRNAKPDSTVWVYFSGHGAPGARGHAYLVPSGGDPNGLAYTAFREDRLYRDLDRLPARRVLVALDACFSGNGGRSVLGKGMRPLTLVRKETIPSTGKLIVFSASRADQEAGPKESAGHGLFTYYFLKGLDGGAEQEGHVTVGSLSRYLKAKVPEAASLDNHDQVPQVEPHPVGEIAKVEIR